MSFSHETQNKINQFAKEQSQHYLEKSEMTYIEKLREKTGRTRSKINRKLARFKGSSDSGREAQDDMILYMSDYMNDLMSRGMSEQEAFEKAKGELASPAEVDSHADLNEYLRQYYANRDPAEYEAVGLFYGGFLFLGIAVGGLIGFLTSGGVPTFLENGWIYTLVGAGVGILIGMGLGQISNAIVVAMKRK